MVQRGAYGGVAAVEYLPSLSFFPSLPLCSSVSSVACEASALFAPRGHAALRLSWGYFIFLFVCFFPIDFLSRVARPSYPRSLTLRDHQEPAVEMYIMDRFAFLVCSVRTCGVEVEAAVLWRTQKKTPTERTSA